MIRIKTNIPVLVVAQILQRFWHLGRALHVGFCCEGFRAELQHFEVEGHVGGKGHCGIEADNYSQKQASHFSKKKFCCLSVIGSEARSMTFSKSSQMARFERFVGFRKI